jgi:hypothetical protein
MNSVNIRLAAASTMLNKLSCGHSAPAVGWSRSGVLLDRVGVLLGQFLSAPLGDPGQRWVSGRAVWWHTHHAVTEPGRADPERSVEPVKVDDH